jgi:hypothetical protein
MALRMSCLSHWILFPGCDQENTCPSGSESFFAAGRLLARKSGSATNRIDHLRKPMIRILAATTVARYRLCCEPEFD